MSNKVNVYYCPNCGHTLKAFESNCPACRSQVTKREASEEVKKFIEGLEKIQNKKMPEKKESLLKKVIGKDFSGDDEEREFEEKKEEELNNYIINYPVPPTTEDIISFFLLCAANIDSEDDDPYDLFDAWVTKYNQVYTLANATIKDPKDLKIVTDIHDSRMPKKQENFLGTEDTIGIIIAIGVVLLLSFISSILGMLAIIGICVIQYLNTKNIIPKHLYFRIGIIALLLIPMSFFGIRTVNFITNLGKNSVEWNAIVMDSHLPKYKEKLKGIISTNTDEELSIRIKNVSAKDYYHYIEEVEKFGYTIDVKKTESSYVAFSKDNYKIDVDYYSYNKEMTIDLSKQENYSEFEWPSSNLSSMLPVPESNTGKIVLDTDKQFSVKVADTTKEEYEKYIKDCKEAGFDKNTSNTNTNFNAKNSKRYRLSVSYLGNNVMSISLQEPLLMVKLHIKVNENLLFSKYDVKAKLGYNDLGTIKHGGEKIFEIEVEKGIHTLTLTKDGDSDVSGELDLDIKTDTEIHVTASCTSSSVGIKKDSQKDAEIVEEDNNKTKTGIDAFLDGFEKGTYKKYSTSKSDDYIGNKVYNKGVLVDVYSLDNKKNKYIIGNIKDEDGYQWAYVMNTTDFVGENHYKDLLNKTVYVKGVFAGLASDNSTPMVYMNKIYSEELKKELSGLQDMIDGKDATRVYMITVPEDFVGEDYKTAEKFVKDRGFTNVKLEKKETTDAKNKNGTVTEFTIAGKKYESGTVFYKSDEVKIVYWDYKEPEKEEDNSVSYSTNDSSTVKNGNSGIYAYRNSGASYYNYYIIDFTKKVVYFFADGNGDETYMQASIVSGDLNSTLVIKFTYGKETWQEGLHFKWKRQPDHLIVEDHNHDEFDYYSTSLSDAQTIFKTKRKMKG